MSNWEVFIVVSSVYTAMFSTYEMLRAKHAAREAAKATNYALESLGKMNKKFEEYIERNKPGRDSHRSMDTN